MGYEVVLTDDAATDLQEIHDYIAQFDSIQNADHVLDRLLQLADTLVADPQRGSIPKELRGLGIDEHRQVLFKPYRLVYRVLDERVIIFLIADGRRNMQSLLARRLLRG
jgi:toxin ParE1/3/4